MTEPEQLALMTGFGWGAITGAMSLAALLWSSLRYRRGEPEVYRDQFGRAVEWPVDNTLRDESGRPLTRPRGPAPSYREPAPAPSDADVMRALRAVVPLGRTLTVPCPCGVPPDHIHCPCGGRLTPGPPALCAWCVLRGHDARRSHEKAERG